MFYYLYLLYSLHDEHEYVVTPSIKVISDVWLYILPGIWFVIFQSGVVVPGAHLTSNMPVALPSNNNFKETFFKKFRRKAA